MNKKEKKKMKMSRRKDITWDSKHAKLVHQINTRTEREIYGQPNRKRGLSHKRQTTSNKLNNDQLRIFQPNVNIKIQCNFHDYIWQKIIINMCSI